MWDLLKPGSWNAPDVIILFVMLGIFLTAIVATITVSWSRVRREEIRSNSMRELLDRGMSMEQVERLVGVPADERNPAQGKELEAQFASLLVQNEIAAPTLERVLRIYQSTDPATKKAVYDSLEEIVGSSPSEEQLVAAVKALCPAHAQAAPTGRYEELPAGA